MLRLMETDSMSTNKSHANVVSFQVVTNVYFHNDRQITRQPSQVSNVLIGHANLLTLVKNEQLSLIIPNALRHLD